MVTYVHGGSAYKLEALEVSSVGLTPITSINIKKILNIIQKLKKIFLQIKMLIFPETNIKYYRKPRKRTREEYYQLYYRGRRNRGKRNTVGYSVETNNNDEIYQPVNVLQVKYEYL